MVLEGAMAEIVQVFSLFCQRQGLSIGYKNVHATLLVYKVDQTASTRLCIMACNRLTCDEDLSSYHEVEMCQGCGMKKEF